MWCVCWCEGCSQRADSTAAAVHCVRLRSVDQRPWTAASSLPPSGAMRRCHVTDRGGSRGNKVAALSEMGSIFFPTQFSIEHM